MKAAWKPAPDTLSDIDDATLAEMKDHAKRCFDHFKEYTSRESSTAACAASSAFALLCGEERARGQIRNRPAPRSKP